MRTTRIFLIFILSLLSTVMAVAQDVIVTVTPVQRILPPQALLYVNDPGKYFNVTLTNTSSQSQSVYLSLSLNQITPSSEITVTTPSTFPPKVPFVIPANGTKTLTMVEMKTMFNHIPSNQIKTTPGLFDDYANGSFGLLPEGDYEVQVTAYKWAQPKLETPVVVSSPLGGRATFTICYKAQAPKFLMPFSAGALQGSNDVAPLDVLNPMFTWTSPVVTCSPSVNQYRYTFKVVEVLKNQSPVEAIEKNPVVYRAQNLTVPQCIIPLNVIQSQFYADRTYAAQVTATSANGGALSYVMIENDGKSTYRLFKLKVSDQPAQKPADKTEVAAPVEKQETVTPDAEPEDETSRVEKVMTDDDRDFTLVIGGNLKGEIDPDSLYSFGYPNIIAPHFEDINGARKHFQGSGILVEWIKPMYKGGEGQDVGSIEFAYDVELFVNGQVADVEAALQTEPIYHKRTTELNDSIPWDDIKEKVETGNYMVLRVNPVITKGSSVAFTGDDLHIRDFALVELLSKKYFQCSSMVDITNTTLTSKKAEELKGETVGIGQYQLTIDEVKSTQKGFEGKGHVAWTPFGFEIGVCVKFKGLKINTDGIVIEGIAETYSDDETSDIQVVDKLFSDWGIDNLISDTGIPYASEISGLAKDKVKDIAKQIDLQKYYGYVKRGNAIYDALTTGKVANLYMPLSLPKSINKSPVDIQIVGMKFAPDYATMDILGEFTLPNSQYTKNDILVLGAPRICISPDRLLPESGTIALLSDFTIQDPKSKYEMTFKAPTDVLKPENGCFVSWHADQFEMLGLDLDMKIPGLLKDNNGTVTDEKPVLNVNTTISTWDDWMAEVTMDPFQVSALPGWTFTAQNIIYDHSFNRNSSHMGAFPEGYNKKNAGISSVYQNENGEYYQVEGDNMWQGLYIKNVGIRFPKSLEFGTSGDKRLLISAQDMFFDKSGATLKVSAENLLEAKTGKAGGWEFSLDKVHLSFLQSNFNDCGFMGTFAVPLLKGTVDYECQIKKLTSNANNGGQYAYLFKTQQMNDLSLDFFLAEAKFKKDQTYFLLESVPDGAGKQQTNLELMMGGDLTIGGTDYLNKKIKNSSLPMKFEIPGVHFCGLRIANCPGTWTSKYASDMQSKAKNAKLSGTQLYAAKKDIKIGDYVYLNMGKWSLASLEKKLGPFEFTLSKYDFDFNATEKRLSASLAGEIKVLESIELSAGAGFTINANVTVPKGLDDLKNFSASYKSTDFDGAKFGTKFAGTEISGTLSIERNDKTKEGFTGALKFVMPGDLFTLDATGGYYKYSDTRTSYRYGYFLASVGSSVGLRIDPVVINKIQGGFYFNCSKKSDTEVTPKKGVIGVIAGLGLTTSAGDDMLKGDFDMTVVYDQEHDRLTTFMLNGNVEAVSGLVNSKASVVYQHDDNDQYFAINVSVDAKADGTELAKKYADEYGALGNMMKSLNSKYETALGTVKGSLTGKIDDQSNSNAGHATKAKDGDTSVKASADAHIALDFKVTMKEEGRKLSKVKWHVYLGEPTIDKRCSITLIDFKSKIVNVKIGANCYLCIGNELPNDGKLPAIPTEISQFLDGSTKGSGVVSDDVSMANRARTQALKDFNAQPVGGVMLGAQVFGYIDVDLGIFYGNMGATAGFDMSLVKLGNSASCTNLGRAPGWHNWYGEGQLYAYLYAKFGVHVNLGFWDKKFDIVDAGIGGVLNMGGPKPTYFTGKARCKLRLLDGLVNIDRKFQFECGDRCDLFVGNALDNFKLFGECSIGDTLKSAGWSDKNVIDPQLVTRPYYTTEAPLEEHFRVLDETELNKLAKDYNGDKEDLKAQASRTFIFRTEETVTVREYKNRYSNWETRTFNIKGKQRLMHVIDMLELNPNKYYSITVTGYAKEIIRGEEVDPLFYNEKKKKMENRAWKQTLTYYFRTGAATAITDCPDLQKYVAMAYPSRYNRIKDEEDDAEYVKAYVGDVKAPTIGLTKRLSDTCFKNGSLNWRLLDASGNQLDKVGAEWWHNPNFENLQSIREFNNVQADKDYVIKLEYTVSSVINNRVVTNTTELASLKVRTCSGTWMTGYLPSRVSRAKMQTTYSAPFVGNRINTVTFANAKPATRYSDKRIAETNGAKIGNEYIRLYDPYWYISYLSNYAFVGGFEITTGRLSLNATTSQSCVYTDKGGVYEGVCGRGVSYRIYDEYEKVRKLSIYDESQWGVNYYFPLPVMTDSKYDYVLSGQDERTPKMVFATDNKGKVANLIADMKRVYYVAEDISNSISEVSQEVGDLGGYKFETKKVNEVETWNTSHTGASCYISRDDVTRLEIPMYQFPILWGSTFDNSDSAKKITMWGSFDDFAKSDERPHRQISQEIWFGFMGGTMSYKAVNKNGTNTNVRDKENFKVTDAMLKKMKSANFSVYRVNAYNYNTGQYMVCTNLRNGEALVTFDVEYPLSESSSSASTSTPSRSATSSAIKNVVRTTRK